MPPDPSIITALAALGGSLVGGLSSFATTHFTQTFQAQRDRAARDVDQREAIYIQFIDHAAALFLDSIDTSLEDPDRLVAIGAVMARIRLVASAPVIAASTDVMREILASYDRPALARRSVLVQTQASFTDPLAIFTDACREERTSMLGRF